MSFELNLRNTESVAVVGEIVSWLGRALQHHRSAILLVIYKSSITRLAAELAIAKMIGDVGTGYCCVRITSPQNAEAPFRTLSLIGQDEKIFFASGWQWGGVKSYRVLNIRREQLIDEKIKGIFWLTESEARKLPTAAPDFWSFRHRVFSILELPRDQGLEPATYSRHDFVWPQIDMSLLRSEAIIKRDLRWRQRNLDRLPDDFSSYLTRGQQNFVLSALYWAESKYILALNAIEEAKDYSDRIGDKKRRSAIQVGLGHIACGMEKYDQALDFYEMALKFDSAQIAAFVGRGNVYRFTGLFSKAEATYRQGLRQTPDDPALLNGLGKTFLSQGRDEESIALFQRAVMGPALTKAPFEGLAQAYRRFGQIELAQEVEQQASAFEKESGSFSKKHDVVQFASIPALAS